MYEVSTFTEIVNLKYSALISWITTSCDDVNNCDKNPIYQSWYSVIFKPSLEWGFSCKFSNQPQQANLIGSLTYNCSRCSI